MIPSPAPSGSPLYLVYMTLWPDLTPEEIEETCDADRRVNASLENSFIFPSLF